jgi:hypothetical protein
MAYVKIEKKYRGLYSLNVTWQSSWLGMSTVAKEMTIQDLINLEGEIHALVLQHEMGDQYNAPKSTLGEDGVHDR